MSGGDWNPFENECRVRAAAGGDDRNQSRPCSRLTSASRLWLVDTPVVGSLVAFFSSLLLLLSSHTES